MRLLPGLALVALLGSCGDFPKDSKESLKRVRSGEPLKVGFSPAEPWVSSAGTTDGPAGPEPDLIREWARAEGARILWVRGSEAQLVEGLEQNDLDIAVAGLVSRTAHGARIGMTQPYLTAPIVIGAARGVSAPDRWDGVQIRYDGRRPHFAASISAVGAVPIPAPPDQLGPFAAVYRQELQSFGLADTGDTLRTEKRVIATAPAENALTFSLDRFLHARRGSIEARLGGEARLGREWGP